MKHLLSLVLLAFVFTLTGCSQDAVSPEKSTMRVTGSGGGDACFDIPAPAAGGAVQGDVVGTGHAVVVSWQFARWTTATDYTTKIWHPQGKLSINRTGMNPSTNTGDANYNSSSDAGFEFWGGSQRSIVRSPSYSGHYDIERSSDNGVTWVSLGSTTGHSYTDNNSGAGLPDGTYQYRLKAKSNEGSSPNTCTHHSEYSSVMNVTVTTCSTLVTYSVNSESLTFPHPAEGSATWLSATELEANNGQNLNLHLYLYIASGTTCSPGTPTIASSGDPGYQMPLWYSFNGGAWVELTAAGPHYQTSGDHLAIPDTGDHWPFRVATDAAGTNIISTLTVYPNSGH